MKDMWHLYEIVVSNSRLWLKLQASRSDTRQPRVVLWLRIGEPQGDGLLVWHRGEELPRLFYFKS